MAAEADLEKLKLEEKEEKKEGKKEKEPKAKKEPKPKPQGEANTCCDLHSAGPLHHPWISGGSGPSGLLHVNEAMPLVCLRSQAPLPRILSWQVAAAAVEGRRK